VLLMKIGGGNHGIGIHGTHLGPGRAHPLRHSDEARQNIPWVEYNGPGGKTVYATPKTPSPTAAACTMREMDCMDCHNRPTHSFELPERGLDRAMGSGDVSPSLPFAKKKALEILKVNYSHPREEAASRIPAAFAAFYQQNYPEIWAQPAQLKSRLRPRAC
jgi:hypothetical protein